MARRKSLWKYLEGMPPIDWEYLASQQRRNVKGEPQPKWWNQKAHAVKRKNAARRRAAAAERTLRAATKARRAAWQRGLTGRIMAAMEPGRWYGRPDIQAASGVRRNSVHGHMAALERRGLVERWSDPDWRIDRRGAAGKVKTLFRLSEAGERLRRECLKAKKLAEVLR